MKLVICPNSDNQRASLIAQLVKNLPAVQETWVRFLGWEDPLEKEMATHSSILAWRILILAWRIQYSCLENSRRLQSMGVTRVGHDLVTKPPPPDNQKGAESGLTSHRWHALPSVPPSHGWDHPSSPVSESSLPPSSLPTLILISP